MRSSVWLLLVFCATALGGGARLDRHPWREAITVRSRNFSVQTNTYRELAASLAASLEEAHAHFEDRFGPLSGRAARHMRVALYGTREEYMKQGGGVEGAVGHFDAALDRCAIAWRGDLGDAGWPIAIHEACHYYMRRRYPLLSPPSWYAEGIACYYEGLLDPSQGCAGVSRLRLRAARAALEAGDAKLSLLLSSRARVRSGKLKLTNFAPSRFYALSWSLLHLLATDDRYEQGLRRFELRLFSSPPGADARELLREECGDLKELESAWHAHLRGMKEPPAVMVPPVYGWELGSRNAYVRYAALRRLGQGELREGLLRCMRDRDLYVRTQACRRMAERLDRNAVSAMTAALDLGSPELKRIAIDALANPIATEAVPRLANETDLREEALLALTVIGDPGGFPALRDGLTDRMLSARTRANCAAALAEDPGSVAALIVAASDTERKVRSAARASLLRLGRDFKPERPADWGAELDFLRRQMELGRKELHPEVSYALLQVAGHKGVDQLLELLEDGSASPTTRARICALLALAGSKRALPALRRLCWPRNPELVRLEAIRALVHLTGERRGFEHGQPARAREAAFRAWAQSR
ncbi:MAG: HEAT repeat domain-containing protein [Planctomycetota bacterium]|jgi:HEAT repeat protein